MSSVFTTIIDGTGTFSVPEDDADLAAASAGIASLLAGLTNLSYDAVLAYVRHGDGGSGRTLNCLITNAKLDGAVCPSSADTTKILADIKTALLASTEITSVSIQEASLVDQSGSGGGLSFPGIENVWFVDKGSNTTTDGSVQYPFHNIQDGIDAASDGDLVLVYPGTYVEQISAVAGVTVRGIDQLTCILENTGADAGTAPLGDTPVGEWHIENMTIRATGGDGSIIHRFGNNAPLELSHEFIDCYFTGGQFQETPHRSMTKALFLRCRSTGDTNGFNLTGDQTTGRQIQIRFSEHKMDCSPIFDSRHGAGGTQIICFNATRPGDSTETWTVEGDWTFAAGASWIGGLTGGLRFGSSGTLSLYLCYLDGGVVFTGTPGSVEVVNSVFALVPGGRGDMDVDPAGPSQVVVNKYSGNSQQRGLAGSIVIASKERNVGGDQSDRYMSLQDACDSVLLHDTVIRLREDVVLNDPLTLTTYRQKIEGDGKHTLTGSAAHGTVIVGMHDDWNLEFENIELSGRLEINGVNTILSLGHNVEMFGSVSIDGGDATAKLVLDHAHLEGSSVYPYPIIIRDGDPFVTIKGNSFVIGYRGGGGYEAIRYEVDNKNVQVGWSTISHGSIGVGNAPFMRTFAGAATGYSSHHSVYNVDPQAGGFFANAIGVDYDIYDPAAVY
jgi:hypothetical protein